MSLISNVGAYTYTDKISALAVAPSPYNNGGNNYNIVYIGTSNGHIYLFNEQRNTIQSVIPTGYTGTLSGEITGLTVDPAGKYLFVNAPYDNHCLRIPLISVDFLSGASTVTAPMDRDIYRFGDNIGDIIVDSQGVVYIVSGYGRSISIIERYGNSFIDLLFQNEGPALRFKGITLSPNEQRIYAADSQFGSVYYYDFLSNQPTFDILNAPGVFSQLGGLASSGNNIFYTQKDGVYAQNSYLRALVRVAGNGLTTYVATTDPQRYTLIGTNAVTSDIFGNIYLSSSNVLGQSQLYKVSFELVAREGYQPPPARQQLPILQPYPTTSCKRIVEPFSPRLRFGWGLTNTRKTPILDFVKSPLCCPPPIVNCPVTPFYCPPVPIPSVPSEPVAPIYPITVATRQFGDHGDATGFLTNIYQSSTVIASTSLVFIAESSSVQAGMGPLGEVYYLGGTGTVTKLYNGLATSSFFAMGSPSRIAGPVVATTGAIVVVTDYGMLYRISSNAAVYQYYPIKLGQQVAGTPACITNNAFDYIVAGYGNTIGAFRASNASTAWSATTQALGELFTTSVATDGINVFAATNTNKVYCYVAETGTLNWVYPVTTTGSSVFTPYVTSKNIGITSRNDSNIFILSNTTVRQSGYDITVTFPGIRIVSPPLLSTDVRGMLWAHVITDTGTLYGFGGIFSSASGPSYQYVWSNIFSDEVPTQYQIPVIDSAGFIYTSSVYGVVNQYNAYYTDGIRQTKNTSFIINKTERQLNRPIQVSLTPLITSQNIMYVIGRDTLPTSPTYGTNYMYTLSGDASSVSTPTEPSLDGFWVAGSYGVKPLTAYNADGNSSGITLALDDFYLDETVSDSFIVKYNLDGVAVWGVRMGGSGADTNNAVYSVAVDSNGNLYSVGSYEKPLTVYNADGSSEITLTKSGNTFIDSFIVKYNSVGVAVWATRLAGADNDLPLSAEVDLQGNVYVVGYYSYSLVVYNSNGNLSVITLTGSDNNDAFVVKYNSAGFAVWAAKITGAVTDSANSITVDSQGNAYVVGHYTSSLLTVYNSDGTSSAITLANSGTDDAFIIKYNLDGVAVWGARIAGAGTDIAESVTVDSQGNLYVAGRYRSLITVYNSNGTSSGITLINSGSQDAFIVKYNSTGFAVWATRIAGVNGDVANSVTVDFEGNMYVTGYYRSFVTVYNSDSTSSGITLTNIGSYDAFVVKYNSAGFAVWAAKITGAGINGANSITVDSQGNVYVAGYYTSNPLIVYNSNGNLSGITLIGNGIRRNAFVVKYNSAGFAVYATRMAGAGRYTAQSVVAYKKV